MMTGDLLSSEGIAALSSSWPFLLGVGSSTLNLCTNNLEKHFVEKGSEAFDIRFLATNRLGLDNANSAPLSPNGSSSQSDASSKGIRFDGASQFFFVAAGLLHCSLYPLLRVERSFHQKYNQVLGVLQDMNKQPGTHVPPHLRSASRTAVVGWMGFSFFLEDPAFVADMTKFALLQLRWLLDLARKGAGLHSVPDWFCKEPSRWLAHVAATTTGVITPAQADEAVGVITELLTIGSEDKSVNPKALSFSPVVLTELVRVAASFVQAGVRRSRRGGRNRHNDHTDPDDPALYLSFDKNDLGVAVFANDRVCRELCPTLLRAFRAMDIVEGLNVDVEADFDKYSVKLEISNLLTILWGLPNGRCKASILELPNEELASFICSLAAAITFLLDDAIQRYTDACRLQNQIRRSPQDNSFMERQSQGAIGNFCSSRKLLLLLWKVSEQNNQMARAIGTNQNAARAVGSLVIHFLELLTSAGGQTNPDLDPIATSKRSSAISASVGKLDELSLRELVSKLVDSRRTLLRDFGLDISVLVHQLLALVVVWDEAAADSSRSTTSAIVDAMALHEDCDVARYKATADRLIPNNDQGTKDALQLVLLRDGYVGSDVWATSQEHGTDSSTRQKQRENTSRQAQISHATITAVVPKTSIMKLLEKLESNIATRTKATGGESVVDIGNATRELLAESTTIAEDMYTESTRGWKISSEPFADSKDSRKFIHYFDKNARSHGSIPGSGRALLEEAKKSKRGIPEPHPNASIFLCIGEERMDLVRAAMTGPTDTPYSMGLFVFDVFFPPSYPQIPPLVQFMTTGGGQVRFGPVCASCFRTHVSFLTQMPIRICIKMVRFVFRY